MLESHVKVSTKTSAAVRYDFVVFSLHLAPLLSLDLQCVSINNLNTQLWC